MASDRNDLHSGSHKVCPRCGTTVNDSVWCQACGLNLRTQGELPTADAYAAKVRERRWLASRERDPNQSASGETSETAHTDTELRSEDGLSSAIEDDDAKKRSLSMRRGWRISILAAVVVLSLAGVAGALVALSGDSSNDSRGESFQKDVVPGSKPPKLDALLSADSEETLLIQPRAFRVDGEGGFHGNVTRAMWRSWGSTRTSARGHIEVCLTMQECEEGRVRVVASKRKLVTCGNDSFYLYKAVRVYGDFKGSGTELFSSDSPCKAAASRERSTHVVESRGRRQLAIKPGQSIGPVHLGDSKNAIADALGGEGKTEFPEEGEAGTVTEWSVEGGTVRVVFDDEHNRAIRIATTSGRFVFEGVAITDGRRAVRRAFPGWVVSNCPGLSYSINAQGSDVEDNLGIAWNFLDGEPAEVAVAESTHIATRCMSESA